MPSVVGQGVPKAFMCIPKKFLESGVPGEGTTTMVAEALSEPLQLAWMLARIILEFERQQKPPLLQTC
jgi:hypothetical protein